MLALDTEDLEDALDRQVERDFPATTTAEALMSFDPTDPQTRQCPHPHYERMRAEDPVHWVESSQEYLVTRHDLVLEVLRDPVTFSSRRTRALMPLTQEELARVKAAQDEGHPRLAMLIAADAPDHTRHRRLVSKAFSPRTIATREDSVRTITTRLIDSWIDRGRIEFVQDFAVPLPVEVIADALNIPHDLMGDFKRWSDDAIVGFGDGATVDQLVAAERGVNELQRHLEAELDERRVRPQDDLLTSLLEARIDDDDPEVDRHPAAGDGGGPRRRPAADRGRQRDHDQGADRADAAPRRPPGALGGRAGGPVDDPDDHRGVVAPVVAGAGLPPHGHSGRGARVGSPSPRASGWS